MLNVLRRANLLYKSLYARRPILALACTSAIIAAIGDILAQSISLPMTDTRPRRAPTKVDNYDEFSASHAVELVDSTTSLAVGPLQQFDLVRLLRFTLYSTSIAPLLGTWYAFLEKKYPLQNPAGTRVFVKSMVMPIVRRVVVDRILCGPTVIAVFFASMSLMEGSGIDGLRMKFREGYKPALYANCTFWTLAQVINFALLPLPYRMPFISFVGIFWNGYLSWLNSTSDKKSLIEHGSD